MVVDWVLGAARTALMALTGLLPEVGERPDEIRMIWDALGIGNYFVPVFEVYQFLLWAMPATLGAWVVVRFVRYFLPGG